MVPSLTGTGQASWRKRHFMKGAVSTVLELIVISAKLSAFAEVERNSK